MKIAILHNQFSRGGGMEAYMLLLVKGFLALRDEVTIHTYDVDRQVAAQFPCAIRKYPSPPAPGRWKKYLFLRQCNITFRRQEYDISLSLTRTACQDIAVCGGVHPEMVRQVKRSSLFRFLHDRIEIFFEKKMFATVPVIIAHSRSIAREIVNHYGIHEDKIRVLYPPIDTERFSPATSQIVLETRARLHISSKKRTFLFPSCGHNRKGLQELLLAFEQLDPHRYELLVAGGRLSGKMPENVRHIGYIQELSPIYSAVDYTILPAHYEPFGLVIPESLQCGTPVITTREVGAAELLSPADGIVLENNQPTTIATAIRNLPERFCVSPDFAGRHRLTISQHIADIKALHSALRQK